MPAQDSASHHHSNNNNNNNNTERRREYRNDHASNSHHHQNNNNNNNNRRMNDRDDNSSSYNRESRGIQKQYKQQERYHSNNNNNNRYYNNNNNNNRNYHHRDSNNRNYNNRTFTPEEMYDQRKNQSREERNNSPIKPIKDFNNWLKGVLIYKYVPNECTVLDLCCGKGGDLFKFSFRNIKNYVGVDISFNSLVSLSERYNGGRDLKFPAKLIHADVGKVSIESALDSNVEFDTVSCQFAFHYFFQSKEHVKTALQNATSRLKKGGKFIVTTLDSNVLQSMLKKVEGKTLKNSVFQANFQCSDDKSFEEPFGNCYTFQLEDAVDPCPEYLVNPQIFIEMAKEFNLSLVENLNFYDFYEKYRNNRETENSRPRLNVRDMNEDFWTVVKLYTTFVFEKTENPISQLSKDSNSESSQQIVGGYKKILESDIIKL